jgi:hypothetical protein
MPPSRKHADSRRAGVPKRLVDELALKTGLKDARKVGNGLTERRVPLRGRSLCAKKLGSTYMRTEEVELIAALDDLAAPALETRRRRRPSICFKERNGSP